MKKYLAAVGLLFIFASVGHAGTPVETFYQGQYPLSGTTILTSTASTIGSATLTLVVSTPTTTIGQSGGTVSCRNCFTKFVVQVGTYSVVTVKDNTTTAWTLYGAGLGTTGTNTLSLPEDHLGPFCTSAGNQTQFVITPSAVPATFAATNPQAINVEGYTQCGGASNAGPMN